MNTLNFFTHNKGKWITQRTIYNIQTNKIYTHKSEIIIYSDVDKTSMARIDPVLLSSRSDIYIHNTFNKDICSIAVKSINKISQIKKISKNVEYYYLIYINSINHISLSHSIGKLKIFETVWFVNSNLRLSVSLIQKNNKYILTSFNSDIKINS